MAGAGDRPGSGSGGGGGGGGDGGSSDQAKALLIGAGKSLESLPEGRVGCVCSATSCKEKQFAASQALRTSLTGELAIADLVEGLKAGKLGKDVMQRYINLQDSFLSPLLKFGWVLCKLRCWSGSSHSAQLLLDSTWL